MDLGRTLIKIGNFEVNYVEESRNMRTFFYESDVKMGNFVKKNVRVFSQGGKA